MRYLASTARTKLTAFIKIGIPVLAAIGIVATSPAHTEDKTMPAKTAYDFAFTDIDGTDLKLSDLKGKVVMVVNTASECGFTKQYADLQTLYETYQPRGLVIIGVPSNDFGGQEPGTAAEIKKFCETNYKISFPLTEKTVVSGKQAHPFYQWAALQPSSGVPAWNFHKYIIDREGHLVGSFGSMTNPKSEKITTLLETLLPTNG